MEQNSASETKKFTPIPAGSETRAIMSAVFKALEEKGYDPINQIVGYILTEDPAYITNYQGARNLICKLDRDDLLAEIVKHYLGVDH